jgi:hypothetical protein
VVKEIVKLEHTAHVEEHWLFVMKNATPTPDLTISCGTIPATELEWDICGTRWNQNEVRFAFCADFGKHCPWPETQHQVVKDCITSAFLSWNTSLEKLKIHVRLCPVGIEQPHDVEIWWEERSSRDLHNLAEADCYADGPTPRRVRFFKYFLRADDTEGEWTMDPDSEKFDLLTVAMHEGGHVLGLGHDCINPLMCRPPRPGRYAVIGKDDEDGLADIYKPSTPKIETKEGG